jgi:hypothetical protein
MIHLYAVAENLTALPDVNGVEDAELERQTAAGLDLVVSEHEETPGTSEDAVLAHARVVEALLPLSDALLPARFGLQFDDDSALEQVVQDHDDELHGSLRAVRGYVELGLRVVDGQPVEPLDASSGREYLEARSAEDRLGRELHAVLSERARSATRSEPSGGRLVLNSAYLVDPGAIAEFQQLVGRLQAEHPSLTFALTGPWPPYSFAGVSG